jgi:uncharacterized protein YihD (DUF1040 family)
MRNPERIDQILEMLRSVWKLHPDLRLTQLVVSLVCPKDPCPEVYSFEDTQLVKRLKVELEKITNQLRAEPSSL